MEDKLRKYVDNLFTDTAPTKKAVELKEEMIQNLSDKYSDLLSEGKAEEAAYNIAIAGIGDVSDLLAELEFESISVTPNAYELEAARRRSGMFTAIAVMLYIICFLPAIIISEFSNVYDTRIGIPVAIVIIAVATGLLVYNHVTKPRIYRGSNTMVEEFREWQSDTQNRKSLRRAISFALWSIIVALYFIISFWLRSSWHWTWIIFPLGVAAEAIINIFFTLKN